MKQKITQSLVERAPAPEQGKSALYSDSEIRGFYLVVTSGKRSFYVQSLVNGKQVRTKLGDHPSMDAKQARDQARATLVAMRSGKNPNEERRKAKARGLTLRDALELHLSGKKLSATTVEGYRYNCDQYLSAWLDKPLAEIGADRKSVRERHARLTSESGRATADAVFRVFRAIYSRAQREHPELPANPTANVDFHGVRRRKVDAPADALKQWGRAVIKLNPIRRDLHLFVLLTGMRRTATCESRVEHLDLDARKLHIPEPKGGSTRAFDLVISGPLRDLLAHRVAENERIHRKSPWIFPSPDSKSGHVAELQQPELAGLTGHALRHLYSTLAVEAGVPLLELKFLLNHAANNVTMGYIHVGLSHLMKYQELASLHVLRSVGLEWTPGTWPPALAVDRVNEAN